jgi:hypothetical protein
MRYFGLDGLVAFLRDALTMAAWLGEQIAADARFELVHEGRWVWFASDCMREMPPQNNS